ncbi:hypothetical protein QBC43DRAFT_284770 [Cladorrhinum sp. PSN259]|nr:hypothetical protein QBC43DRAFT_284770 [Cladorrhinum sp. PSN259]
MSSDTTIAPGHNGKCYLLCLPAEIRLMIYSILWKPRPEGVRPFGEWAQNPLREQSHRPSSLARITPLLFVNMQISREAADYLYSQNKFVVWSPYTGQFLQLIGQQNRSSIRDLVIRPFRVWTIAPSSVQVDIFRSQQMLQHSGLSSLVKLTYYLNSYQLERGEKRISLILESLTRGPRVTEAPRRSGIQGSWKAVFQNLEEIRIVYNAQLRPGTPQKLMSLALLAAHVKFCKETRVSTTICSVILHKHKRVKVRGLTINWEEIKDLDDEVAAEILGADLTGKPVKDLVIHQEPLHPYTNRPSLPRDPWLYSYPREQKRN